MAIILVFYTFLMVLSVPFLILRLKWKARKNKGYGLRISERLGCYSKDIHAQAHDIWLHAVSFGEVELSRPLIDAWLAQGKKLCITTTTPTGSKHLLNHYQGQVSHVYLPFEIPLVIDKFLKKFKPISLVIVETELWPNLISRVHKRGIPVVLINARLSEKSLSGYRYIQFIIGSLLSKITGVIAQSRVDGDRFVQLGLACSKLKIMPNLKYNALKKRDFSIDLPAKTEIFHNRPVLLAASTHSGEDEILIDTYHQLIKQQPNLVLVLAPRHPERSSDIEGLLIKQGLNYVTRSSHQQLMLTDHVFILDTLGELNDFYKLATVSFIGGSLVPHGGHNILESINANVPTVTGQFLFNFREISEQALSAGALIKVSNATELVSSLGKLLNSPEKRAELIQKGEQFLTAVQPKIELYLKEIDQLI